MPAKKHTMTEEERSRRFAETARQLECDESGEAFEHAMEKLLPARQPPSKKASEAKGKRKRQ
jgi:hypothetical protein